MVRHSSYDEEEYTIHDLSHAPSAPADHWYPTLQSERSFRGSGSSSLFSDFSSRQKNRRRTLSIPRDFSFRQDRSLVQSEQEKPSSLRSALQNLASHRKVFTSSAPSIPGKGSHDSLPPPLRHRALSQPQTYQEVDNAYFADLTSLSPVQSFPPSTSNERKVMFAASTTSYDSSSHHQQPPTGILFIPQDGEEKEPEHADDDDDEFLVEAGRALDVSLVESSEVEDSALPSNRSRTRSDTSKWTTDSDGLYYNNGGGDVDTLSVDHDSETMATLEQRTPRKTVRVLGLEVPLPKYFEKKRPSWNRVAFFVVEKAPCFWCCRDKTAPTYRTVLLRLNILLAFFALGQLASALWLFIIMLSPNLVDRSIEYETLGERQNQLQNQSNFQVLTNVWNLNGSVFFLGLLGLIMLTAILMTVRAIQNVSIRVFIRLLWLLLWIIPLEIFWGVGLFDSFRVSDVWIKFWWRDRTMAWFRHEYCPLNEYNESTANRECAVPEFTDEEDAIAWCWTYFKSESCVWMRDQAQREMEQNILVFYYSNGVWALCFIVLLFLSVKTLESIISVPLVQKSRESNVPAWLTLPIIGCTICGFLFSFSATSSLNTGPEVPTETSFIGPLFIVAGGLFLISAVVAWCLNVFPVMNVRDKRGKTIIITGLVVVSFVLLVLMATIFSSGVAFSVSLDKFQISDAQRGSLACFIDKSGSCTRCMETTNRCPEWTTDDVTRILQNQGKASATLAAIFFLYACTNMQHAFNLRSRIVDYQIDYV